MKTLALTIAALVVGSSAMAASISVVQGVTGGGNDLYTFSLEYDPGEVIDIFDISVVPNPGEMFINAENNPAIVNFGTPEDSDILGAGTLGIGVTTLLGTIDNDDQLSSSIGGPAGTPLTALMPSGTAFMQVVMAPGSSGGSFAGRFVQGGQATGSFDGQFGIPEPSTVALAGLALVGLVGYSRRRK